MLYQAKGGRLDFCLEKLCLNPGELAEGFEQEFKRWESLTRLGHEHGLCVGVLVAQGPLSMGFSRQEYWSGLSCPSPGDLPDPGIEPRSPALQAGGSFLSELQGSPYLRNELVQFVGISQKCTTAL